MEDVAGQIHHWHATSEKHLAVSSELNNEIFAVDHHSTGLKFATSGYDFKVRGSPNKHSISVTCKENKSNFNQSL